MCSSLLQLTHESRDLSKAEGKNTVVISLENFQNDNGFHSKWSWVKKSSFGEFAQLVVTVIFFSA
jgi:hypothetical protein